MNTVFLSKLFARIFFLLKDFSFFTGPGAMNKVAAMSVKRGGVRLRMPRV